jgi:hypothetical protein
VGKLNGEALIAKLSLPIQTLSEANTIYSKTRLVKTGPRKGLPAREHWREAWLRHKEQKQMIHLFLSPLKSCLRIPCTVRLYRLSQKELDDDNNVVSFKYIRDAIAEVITGDMRPGRADGDKRIKWEYFQEKANEAGIRIEIYAPS